MTHTTPELLGLNNNIKTRSLRVIDFLNNNNLLPNDINSNRIVAHVTGLSQNDFIVTTQLNNQPNLSWFDSKVGVEMPPPPPPHHPPHHSKLFTNF